MISIENLAVLLLVASLVAVLARRIRLPYTVGLVLAGVGLGLVPVVNPVHVTKELIFTAIIPPLIFEAALNLVWKELRKDLFPVGLLAMIGVVVGTFVVGWGLHLFIGWALPVALVFGALISATDPVSVIALFRETGIGGRLKLLVDAESLVNDGAAVVAFGLATAYVNGVSTTTAGAAGSFLLVAGGGVLAGGLVAAATLLLAGRAEDHLVEITFSVVAAYGSFLLADELHLSGILATVTAGVIFGNTGPIGAFSDRGREAVESFWEFAAFAANSVIFLLIGLRVVHVPMLSYWETICVAILLVLFSRALAVYTTSLGFHWSRWKVSLSHQHILFWGGLRGALGLALVLGLPDDFPNREAISVATFGVVAFSVIVQAVTMKGLLRRLKIT